MAWHLENVQLCNAHHHQSRLAADEQIIAMIAGRPAVRRGEKRKHQRIPFRRAGSPSVAFPRETSLSFRLRLRLRLRRGESEGRQKAAGACARHSRAAACRRLPRSERSRPLCACLPHCAVHVPIRVKAQSWTQLAPNCKGVSNHNNRVPKI